MKNLVNGFWMPYERSLAQGFHEEIKRLADKGDNFYGMVTPMQRTVNTAMLFSLSYVQPLTRGFLLIHSL